MEPVQELKEIAAVDVEAPPENSAPAPADSGATAATQPDSERSDCSGQTPASAAAATADVRDAPTPDDVAISRLRRLSGDEKGSRLIEAAKKGDVEEVRLLLEAGADVGARDGSAAGMSALHWAAWGSRVEVARRLLDGGAEVDARTAGRSTPLLLAAECGSTAVVRLLLQASADHSASNRWGWTPLHYATLHGYGDTAAALKEAGADARATDNWGKTPLDIARQHNDQRLMDVLQ